MMKDELPHRVARPFSVYLEDKLGYEITIDDAEQIVEDMQEDFDVFAFVAQQDLPQDEVKIYTNADAALKIATVLIAEKAREKAAEEKTLADEFSIADDYEEADIISEEELTALHQKLVDSTLTVKMEGIAPAAFEAMQNHLKATMPYIEGAPNSEYALALNNELLAKSIKTVTSPTGKVRTKPWTVEEVAAFAATLYISEQNKLYSLAAKLTYVANIFDRAANADF